MDSDLIECLKQKSAIRQTPGSGRCSGRTKIETQIDRKPIERTIGAAILHCRIELGYSQEQLARLAGLHRTYISDIERGSRDNFTATVLAKLAKCLKTSPSRLVEDAEKYLDNPESPRLSRQPAKRIVRTSPTGKCFRQKRRMEKVGT